MVSIGGSHVLGHGLQRRWKTTIFAKLSCQKHYCFHEIGSEKAWKLLVKRVDFMLSMISGTTAWSSTAPRISEEALYIIQKVCLANIFHHFSDSKDFLKNSWKKWKNWPGQHFSKSQAVLEAQIVENVSQANFFHLFRGFLSNLYKSRKWWKKLAGPQHFPRFKSRKRGQANFSTFFMNF